MEGCPPMGSTSVFRTALRGWPRAVPCRSVLPSRRVQGNGPTDACSLWQTLQSAARRRVEIRTGYMFRGRHLACEACSAVFPLVLLALGGTGIQPPPRVAARSEIEHQAHRTGPGLFPDLPA